MTREHDDQETRFLDDESAQRILRQAAELDAQRRSGISIADLRRAALEAGISSEAFDTVVRRLDTQPTAVETTNAPHMPERTRFASAALLAIAGLLAGALADDSQAAIAVLGAALTASAFLAGRYRPGRRIRRFLAEHGAIWTGVLIGVLLAERPSTSLLFEMIGVVGSLAAVSALVGSVIVGVRFSPAPPVDRSRSSGDDSDSPRTGRRRPLTGRLRGFAEWLGIHRFEQRIHPTAPSL